MILHTDPQGSDAWHAARRGVTTASRFRDARDRLKNGDPSRACIGYARDVARELVGGTVSAKHQSAVMRVGVEEEPTARLELECERGYLVEEAGFVSTDDGRFGVSVDGLVGADGVVEIKTLVSSDTLFRALVDGDVSDYRDQCIGAMWILGRQWVDLALWAPDLPAGRLTVIRIERDEAEIAALEADLMAFDAMVRDYAAKLRRLVVAG